MSSDEHLSFRALAARRLVKEATEAAGHKNLFKDLLPGLGGDEVTTQPAGHGLPGRTDPGSTLPLGESLQPLPVCIIGAGIAGLRIAMFLDSQNIKYEIIEASSRHGGRAMTHHFSAAENDYFDLGAMRFPRINALHLTFGLFEELGITEENGTLIEYVMSSDNNFKMFNEQLKTSAEANAQEDPFLDSSHVPIQYLTATFTKVNGVVVKGADALIAKALEPFKVALVDDFDKGWENLMGVDHLSVRGYLAGYMPREPPPGGEADITSLGLPFFVIEWMERMESSTGSYDLAFSEAVLESIQFDYPYGSGSPEHPEKVQRWACVQGGTSVVTDLMCKSLSTKPLYNHRVTAIYMDRSGDPDLPSPKMFIKVEGHPEFDDKAYSHIFATPPLSCLSLMDLTGAGLPYVQRQAIRSLAYGPSVKIGIKFRTRWWQSLPEFPQKGGSSYTDRPVRVVVYPSYGINEAEAPAVLMASYAWTQDALRLGAFSAGNGSVAEQHLLDIVYRDLAAVHGQTPDWYRRETISFLVHDWYHYEFAVGAYAHFAPGQYHNYYADMAMPAARGSLHVVGEAISTQHAWIEGALASAWRATHQALLNERPSLLKSFRERWTIPEEVDLTPIRHPGKIDSGLEDTDIDYETLQVLRGIELSKERYLSQEGN